jgi:hypothetical protein
VKFPQIAIIAKPVKHQVSAMGHIERCLVRNGYRVRLSHDFDAPERIVFCWGWGKAKEIRVRNPEAIICCLDHGYTRNRKQHINTGWSTPVLHFGLNGFAEHPWIDDGGERLRVHGWDQELKPQRKYTGLKRALVLGQVYGDAMIVDHVEDYGTWLRARLSDLHERGWHTTFRHHPIMIQRNTTEKYGNVGRLSPNPDLWTDLAQADLVVAMNSNALVAAYLDGLMVEVYNRGSMLSPLMDGVSPSIEFTHREPWFQRLAWCQWTYPELEGGDWLRVHAPIMHRLVDGGPPRPWHTQRIPT